MDPDEAITGLRAALAQSPDNVPLREHLAAVLLSAGRGGEAVDEYREAIAQGAGTAARLGLAQAFFVAGMSGEALVLVESLTSDATVGAAASLLQARILLNRGELADARESYTRAIVLNPSLSDGELAAMLTDGARETTERIPVSATGEELGPATASTPGHGRTSAERPRITFADVGGMEELKDDIRMKIVYPLTQPELFGAYGKLAGGGILLYGPPGCGKTHLARATAGEIDAAFVAVGIEEVLSMYLGESEQQLHEVFESARRSTPCVVFFDEMDALGARRSDVRTGAMRQLVNQFLVELDGLKSSNEGVLVLAATNAPWHIDDALRRPGRFDRVVFVPPPDTAARAEILSLNLVGKPAQDVDVQKLAEGSEGFSGADLRAVVDRAVEGKLRISMRAGVPLPLETDDLRKALAEARPTTAEWMQTARSYALHANQAGSYDDVLAYVGKKR